MRSPGFLLRSLEDLLMSLAGLLRSLGILLRSPEVFFGGHLGIALRRHQFLSI